MDDETILSGGMMARMSRNRAQVTLMMLTRGDRGNDTATSDPALPAIRRKELAQVMDLLKIDSLIHRDYPDDTLSDSKDALFEDIKKTVDTVKPDLVVTFDPHGWYGHPDHIACSEVVTRVVKGHKEITLWYAVRAEAINRCARVVARLRGTVLTARTKPTAKVYIGSTLSAKINAIYCYLSQMNALRPGITVGFIPMWFFLASQPYEYIVET